MRTFFRLLAALLLPFSASAQHTVQGTITRASTGEPLSFARIYVVGTYHGDYSGTDGRYRISGLKPGHYAVEVSLTGFELLRDSIHITQDLEKNMVLLPAAYLQQEVTVLATRANENSAMAGSTMSREELAKLNFGQDLPMLLNLQPSVVTTSDAGAGVGYTGIRIRGSDGTRVNVTINGIPVNDAESQGVFWVNMPDFASSVDNVQIQRGVGTSTNGAGAFGGSVNLLTDGLRNTPYTDLLVSGGSFNTRRVTLKTGTGLLKKHWAFDGRLSRITSDGYIDRAASDLLSWYASGGWYGEKSFLKAVVFSGSEKTYQAWYGVPKDSLKAGNYTFNPAGLTYDAQGLPVYYENETDNYKQTHYQLITATSLTDNWQLNAALHATRGIGYYEQYRADEAFSTYNLSDAVIGNDTFTTTDLVRRLWLDNWFYGATWSLTRNANKKWQFTFGGAANQYAGDHFGTVLWTRSGAHVSKDYEFYRNTGRKNDVTFYGKSNWQITDRFNLFADMQVRRTGYSFLGIDRNAITVTQTVNYLFFNPKVGITFSPSAAHTFYASVSVGNKEPNRDDLTESSPESRPIAETLYDGEAGWKFSRNKLRLAANTYYMRYKNQLVVTGKVNDVGAYTRQNVANSYRAGIELETAWQPWKKLGIAGNITLSQNRITDYTEYVDDYDNGGQHINRFATTTLAYSPAVVAAAQLNWQPLAPLQFSLIGKHVGRQYLDNTTNNSRSLAAYTVSDFRASWKVPVKNLNELSFSIQLNNLFNLRYSANGYTYGFIAGGPQQFNYYFPQAGRNALLMVTARF